MDDKTVERILQQIKNEKSLALIRKRAAAASFNEPQEFGCKGEIEAYERVIRIIEAETYRLPSFVHFN